MHVQLVINIYHCLLVNLNIPKSKLYIYYNPYLATNTEKVAYNYDGIINILLNKNIRQCVIKLSQDCSHGEGVIVCHDVKFENNKCLLGRYNKKVH